MTFCHATAGNGAIFRTHERTDGNTEPEPERERDGQTDVEVEIVI